MHMNLRRLLLALTGVGVLTINGCGGGGGGEYEFTPYWNQNGMVLADFNGDGRLDVAIATTYISGSPPHAGYVEVFMQTPVGHFDAPIKYPVGPDPWTLAAGDLDGDGRIDLVAVTQMVGPAQINAISDSGGVSVLRQDGVHPGQFLSSQWIATGGGPDSAAIADLNADGAADLLVADAIMVNGRVLLYRQDQTRAGTFLPPIALQTGGGSTAVVLKDLNGDGLNDIVLSIYDRIIVYYQRPGGGFDAPITLASGNTTSGLAVADVDGDGRPDIIAANKGYVPSGGTGGANVMILRQVSPGSFQASTIAVADGAREVAVGDLNGDGIADIAVVSIVYQELSKPSYVTVLLQSRSDRGQFSVAAVYEGSYGGSFIGVLDANGDGFNDIILNDGPSVLLQRVSAPGTFDAVRALR